VGKDYGDVSNSFWDTQTSRQDTSYGGTGKITEKMQDIETFTEWEIRAVNLPDERNKGYTWNIVVGDEKTYPFLSWQPV
jgi:hypothetical protein